MGKPYKLTQQDGQGANIGRAPDGKFTRLEEDRAAIRQAKEDAGNVQDVARETRAADFPAAAEPEVVDGDAVYKETIEWPEAGPVNDADRPPMKLRND